ncbi:MAG: para-aminobenzoate synthetase / 4-amino-4-deoxychorismate lyase [Desulfomicrobiaceae bacterium]|nr:chorismate-binding protein [Desulfomicrobiaceae bacterium]MDI3492363.1 para-aminobenzoate synthetase / 4-amino-4-deoxychorismate lyase [Desulfomicrobiaceae bacterium]MDK2872298.1 para-aminobenzoate synthetase / 4-amino-4-deoxychorismate lyase [Desulfomicrobiaceae bacterium]HCF04983.1 aminodeoxychorismate synthase, component I [Desulfomicrobiaceae bacterium]
MIRAAIAHGSGRKLLLYENPCAVEAAFGPDEVLPVLSRVEAAVENHGLHAVGMVSYEAAAAMDSALPWRDPGPWPLVWFGLFAPRCREVLCPEPEGLTLPVWTPELGPGAYGRAIDRIREFLAAGETYQVNMTYRLRAPFAGDPWSLFCHLFLYQPSPHAVYLETEHWAVCSASPELFFRRVGGSLISRPMKGTAPRGRFREEDALQAAALRESTKERAENVMVVDMVRHDLGRVCLPASVRVPRLWCVERYPTVWQMTSLVWGRTDAGLPQVFQALFPAASITGAPKVRTAQIIQEIEPSARRVYTGALGWVRPGRRAHFNVAIRTVLVDRLRSEAEYGVGGGIVWDSAAPSEWRETLLKARVLGPRPPAFGLVETMRATPWGVPLWPWHRKRLAESAQYFGFRVPWSTLEEECTQHCRGLAHPAVLRLELWPDGRRHWSIRPLPRPVRPYRLVFAEHAVDERDPRVCHKTTVRRHLDAERSRASALGAHDAILVNRQGQVTETTIASILVLFQGQWITPPRSSGLVPGVLRQRLLARAVVREATLTPETLCCAQRVLLVNAVRGAWPAVVVHEGGPGG